MENIDTVESEVVYASFWRRCYCYFVDGLINFLVACFIFLVVFLILLVTDPHSPVVVVLAVSSALISNEFVAIPLQLFLLYYPMVKYSATFGQRALKVKTLDAITNAKITWWQALKKLLFPDLVNLPFLIYGSYLGYDNLAINTLKFWQLWIAFMSICLGRFVIDTLLIIFHKKSKLLQICLQALW